MKRLTAILLAAMLASVSLPAQPVRGVFSFADSLMRNSRIGRAGRQPYTPVSVRPSVWMPEDYDASLAPRYASDERDFVYYLIDRNLTQDALVLLAQPSLVPSDTLSFLRGLALFDDLQLEGADKWLSLSSLEPALFYDVVAKAHLDLRSEAQARLDAYAGSRRELAALQMAGLDLLQGDLDRYGSHAGSFTYSDFNLTESERALDNVAKTMASHRDKSPVAAALFSTLLPGAGQLYAGRTGEALSSFLTVGSMAGITAVNWHKYGVKSWRTIVPGAICSIFYIGNIYGAYVSVDIHNQQFKDETSAVVLYNIHIPLRSIFR